MIQTRTNRRFAVKLAALGLATVATSPARSALANDGSPTASPVAPHDASETHTHESSNLPFLAVADTEENVLYVYDGHDFDLIGMFDGVGVQAHAGFLPLESGEVLFIDTVKHRLVSVGVVDGQASIIHEVALPGDSVSHLAIDSDHAHYAAVGTNAPESPIFLVDLEHWQGTPVALPEAGEVGLFVTHDNLFHRNDVSNQIEAYTIEQLLAGDLTPISTVAIGSGGHGESLSPDGATLYTATDDGIDVVSWDGVTLTYLTTYGWDTEQRTGGRGYFQRLSQDGSHVISYTANREAPETEWTTWSNDVYLADVTTGEIQRTEIGLGYVYRFALTKTSALFYLLGDGEDIAMIVDLDASSANYGEIRSTIALPPMSTGAKAGESIYEANQYRSLATTPDGALGFVTQGGDGTVVVLDLITGTIASSITVPTPLNGGGYLAVFGTSDSFSDTIAR